MSVRWSKVLTIGANLAVVAGLVFVGMEVRNSRAAAAAQIADGIADGFIEHNMAVIQDPELACIYVVGLEKPEALTDEQAIRFSMYYRALFNQYFRVHDLHETGLLREDTWRSVAAQAAWIKTTPGGRVFFEGNAGAPQRFLDAIAVHAGAITSPNFTMGRPVPDSCESR